MALRPAGVQAAKIPVPANASPLCPHGSSWGQAAGQHRLRRHPEMKPFPSSSRFSFLHLLPQLACHTSSAQARGNGSEQSQFIPVQNCPATPPVPTACRTPACTQVTQGKGWAGLNLPPFHKECISQLNSSNPTHLQTVSLRHPHSTLNMTNVHLITKGQHFQHKHLSWKIPDSYLY